MHEATLRLFNAIQISQRTTTPHPPTILERTIQQGYLLDPAIAPDDALLAAIERVVGLSGEQANAAFHKSWRVVQESPLEMLILQQIIHYLTTYGLEQLGIDRHGILYIPAETLELPALQSDIPLRLIKGLDAQAILARILTLGAGIALAPTTLADIMTIVRANDYEPTFVERIQNRELRALLADHYGLIPTEPVEFLRYLINRLTGETLLIKNDYLIDKIKAADGQILDRLLPQAPANLAAIFLRYKPLFLALKAISSNKTFFNRLRKDAAKQHTPLPADYLNSVTTQIKTGRLDLTELQQRVARASIWRAIRLAYALQQRLHPGDSTLYRVRNGRGWVAPFAWPAACNAVTEQAFTIVLGTIADAIRARVSGKQFYLPAHVQYALPATEKQFTGHLPTGTSVAVAQDLLVGIHWQNTAKRVDLDLSTIGASGKIGWDAAYRTGDRRVLFSGDMTDAPPPHGATELFYLKAGDQEPRILFVNYFNLQEGDTVECRLLVAQEESAKFGKNYMVDVSKLVATATLTVNQKQTILGLLAQVDGVQRVYLAQVSVGNSITATKKQHTTAAREYLVRTLIHAIDLRELLHLAGAIVVTEKPDGEYTDLSPMRLEKGTIIELLAPSQRNLQFPPDYSTF